MARIGIVVPTFNGQAYLAQTIAGVQAQTLTEWELVIVDDGSTDASATVAAIFAARDSRIRLISQANQGIAGARNRGLRELSREMDYIIFIDHDDTWENEALAMFVQALDADTNAPAVHGAARFMNAAGRQDRTGELEWRSWERWTVAGGRPAIVQRDAATTFAMLLFRNCIETTGQMLVRRDALEAAGLFNTALSPADDWDMWLRLSYRHDLRFVDRVILNHRRHTSNASHDRAAMHRAMENVRCKWMFAPCLSTEQRHLARLAHRWSRWDTSHIWRRWARQSLAQRQWAAALRQARHALLDQAAFVAMGIGPLQTQLARRRLPHV